MKRKKLGRQIIVFFIIISIINAASMVGWFILKTAPVLENLSIFKENIALELKKDYSDIDELKSALEEIIQDQNIVFRIEDTKKNIIIKEKLKGITLFSDITNVGNEVYLVSFMSHRNISFTKLIFEGCIFQIFEVTLLFVFSYLISRRKIIKPMENIINDIRNYKFGKKPSRKEIANEFDLIENEFVNLCDELDREKLEQNRIIASISHDIKTPLTSIIGYADLINDENDIKTLKKYNNKIIEKALHLKDVLSTFDDYLVNYDKLSLKLTTVTIKDIVEQLNSDYKLELENNKIQFNVSTKLNKEEIEVDVLKLKRIFSNLISNSTRFLQENGKIDITINKEDNYYRFIISDNGVGIEERIIEKIFDPFYTTDKSRKISGLGLSICKEFVNMHKGMIRAYNSNGLTIEFTIPIKQKLISKID